MTSSTTEVSKKLTPTNGLLQYRPRVYISRQLPQRALDLLLGRCNVSFWDSPDPAPRTELLVNVPGCDVLVCMPSDKIDREVLNAAGKTLKIVATMSGDLAHIETAECSRRNIRVIPLAAAPIVEAITQMVVALFRLAASRWIGKTSCNMNTVLQAKDIIQALKADHIFCLELSNRTVGIFGLGSVGLSVGKAFKELGMTKILYTDVEPNADDVTINAEFVSRDELLTRSDVICVCWNMKVDGKSIMSFERDSFKRMKSSAILLDATKRFSADFTDMYEALRNGEIAAAGLDVREYDIIPNRHPLDGLDNCFFLPYRECYKWDGRRKLATDLVRSILISLQELEFERKQKSSIVSKPERIDHLLLEPVAT
ncbi:glyoxylate reductase/hydroxypyruvate reductase-like [Mya arenaria]|nr:glyoxylate reductase/hydroxypyruvate reductase-like [Mya arenaria]